MKKTSTINLSGIVFHIDDEAFDRLRAYLDSIEKHFSNGEESREILSDIEARIAEIFRTRINNNKQVIILKDVEEMISIMGKPEDFGDPDTENEEKSGKQYNSGIKNKRMYRDTDNRILGGVCSGMGAYFQIDPNIIRGLFIVAFLIFLSGLFLYVILWIVIPEAKTTAQKLEMQGESVNISNIGKKVKDEFENVKENVKKTMNFKK